MNSSTVKPLALAGTLTLLEVSSLTVREYQPLSGMDVLLSDVLKSLTGQLYDSTLFAKKKGAI